MNVTNTQNGEGSPKRNGIPMIGWIELLGSELFRLFRYLAVVLPSERDLLAEATSCQCAERLLQRHTTSAESRMDFIRANR